ncbi:MAG TPA: BTAD domain-containing putative transcriptional regulator [Pseudonocardiaceae bacterium]|nr:BTAD domain-containing putative transcriptional regulator [Pseudonocardiaceae bacterium]
MHVNVLGPLEIIHNGQTVPLNGVKQRAALGFLALRPNRVVPTSELLDALWGKECPTTARKILHNAVSRVRTALACDDTVSLVTKRPGYLLTIDTRDIDMFRFCALADRGRAELAAGSAGSAAATLRRALALWRGPALADLAESGVAWAELDRLRRARTAAFEDRMDAELAIGRHRDVVEELAAAAREHGFSRERLCCQYMLALYRTGRQTDALAVFSRARTTLVEELGLDPGAELVELERAILAHDPKLRLPEPVRHVIRSPPPEPVPAAVAERKRVTAVAIASAADDLDDIVDALAKVDAAARPEVSRHGGTVLPTVGSTWLALFGIPRTGEDDAEHAVRTALAMANTLSEAGVRIAVATAPAIVRPTGHGDAQVVGGPVDRCLRLLDHVPLNGVRVCDETRRATAHRVAYATVPGPLGIAEIVATRVLHADVPFVDRVRELDTLAGLLADVRRTGASRLVTVVGEPGFGKTRLVEEFAQAAEPIRVERLSRDAVAMSSVLGPTLVVLEDLHDADDTTLDAVDDLVARTAGQPVLVLATTRPGLLTRRPDWPVTLALPPLAREATERLLSALLVRCGLTDTPDIVRALAADVGGNPLFAVEYVRMLRDDVFGDISVHPNARLPVPGSVHGIVAARLDSLPRPEKNVLQDAAVIGDAVSAEVLAAMGDADSTEVARALERLEQAALLRRTKDGYRIGSTPLRDTACSQLPRPIRVEKHGRVARIRES